MTRFIWKKGIASLPIRGEDIPAFKAWVCWHGFSKEHAAFDFAAYITQDNKCVLGLPEKTPVRTIADGIVAQVMDIPEWGAPYGTYINIEHGKEGSGMFSSYHHIVPLVEGGGKSEKRRYNCNPV